MCDIEKEIIENLTDTERKNIGDILKALKDEDKKSIINCINNCTSPVTIEVEDKNIQEKIKTIFNAFTLFPISETQILILGQDPYPEQEKAQGLSFSVKNEYTQKNGIDDSLLNIFTAIQAYKNGLHFCDLSDKQIKEIKGTKKNKIWTDFWKTDLTNWAKNNGVLLLNTALTYEKTVQHNDIDKKSLTKQQKNEIKNAQKELLTQHQNAWKPFIKEIIANLIKSKDKLAVFLWGVPAQNLFYEAINNKNERFSVFIEYYEKNSKNKDGKVGKKLIQSYCYQINNLKIFLTSHPSKQGFWRGFKNVAPNHFDCCDKFLGKYIWKNFPENNKKQ